ncbi:MAG: hypothetical protein ACK4EX_03495 [Thermaurantimonas sp.]|uniref:hypothetical protein n=1 Tax=Thermaurantimonas sp. TaxID=2681568 RepID=UPI00391919CC
MNRELGYNLIKYKSLVDKILVAIKQKPKTNTSHWEREIDRLVYQLYELMVE